MGPDTDGVDHINVYSKGETELGRWLSNFACSPFELPDDGHFESVEGYWYWLFSRDDRLRKLSGYAAKELGRKLRSEKNTEASQDHKEKVLKAIDAKLKSNPRMLRLFAESHLPFAHYYVFGVAVKEAGYHWIIDHLESRRKLLKEHWEL